MPHTLYRITVGRPGHAPMSYCAIFANSAEAVLQTMADWPDARSVTIKRVSEVTA